MATTYEDVLNLFRETDRKFQETERKPGRYRLTTPHASP